MSFDFSKFDEQFADIIDEVENTTTDGDYEDVEVPHGKYEVEVVKLALVETKSAPVRPMMTVWFKILDGEYKGQMLFMNQVMTHPYPIALARDFVKSLEPTNLSQDEIKFEGFDKFADLLITAYEGIEGQLEYGIEYSETKDGYDRYEITDVFEL